MLALDHLTDRLGAGTGRDLPALSPHRINVADQGKTVSKEQSQRAKPRNKPTEMLTRSLQGRLADTSSLGQDIAGRDQEQGSRSSGQSAAPVLSRRSCSTIGKRQRRGSCKEFRVSYIANPNVLFRPIPAPCQGAESAFLEVVKPTSRFGVAQTASGHHCGWINLDARPHRG
jgi:hypothetical protein